MTLFATDLFATDTLTIALLCVCIMQYYFAIIDLLMCYTFFVIHAQYLFYFYENVINMRMFASSKRNDTDGNTRIERIERKESLSARL